MAKQEAPYTIRVGRGIKANPRRDGLIMTIPHWARRPLRDKPCCRQFFRTRRTEIDLLAWYPNNMAGQTNDSHPFSRGAEGRQRGAGRSGHPFLRPRRSNGIEADLHGGMTPGSGG